MSTESERLPGDIARHIDEWRLSVRIGESATIAEISRFQSSQYPDGDASPGAIAARLVHSTESRRPQGVKVLDDSPRSVRRIA